MNIQNRKHLLIAGGTGFIGKRFIQVALKNGYICHVLTRSQHDSTDNLKYYHCDLLNINKQFVNDFFKNINFESVIYMAANIPLLGAKKENYEDAMYSTLVPFVKFAQSTLELAKKFIYVSSIDCVGIPSYTDYDENIKLNPYTPYAVAKLSGEKYIESMTQSKNIPLTILRFSQVYGPNEPLLRIIPILLDSIKNDKTFNLYGTGEEKRRFLYVKDAAKAVLCALNSNNTGIYNIAGASIESINELIAIVEKTYNKKLILNKIDCFHKTFDNIPSIENARKLIDYKPEYTLDLGIKEIYNEENNG